MNLKQVYEISIRAKAEGVDGVTNSLNRMADAQEGVAQASVQTEKASTSLERRMESLRRSLDVEYRQKQELAKIERDLARAREVGIISQERQQKLSAAAQARYSLQTSGADVRAARSQEAGAAFRSDLESRLIASGGRSARDSASAFDEQLSRLEEIARLKAQEAGSAFSSELTRRLVAGASKSARDSAAVFEAELARLDEIAKARSQQAAISAQAAFSQFMGVDRARPSAANSAAVFQEQFAQQDALARSAASLRQQLLPMETEISRSQANLAEIAKLESARVVSAKEAVAMRAAEALRTEQARKSIEGMYIAQNKYTSGVGLARNEMVNLSRQVQDVAVTLQAGQPLSTILLQQGTQIFDIFSASDATLKGFASQVATGARALITSFAGIAGGALAIGAGLAWAGTRYGDAQNVIERQINGIGRASGSTVADINRIGDSIANVQRISISAARDISATFAGTGRIGNDNNQRLTGITRDFAAQTGESDLSKAAQELAKAFSGDVVRGAEQLNEKLGFLNERTRAYIQQLQDQGNRQGAIRATLDAMSSSVDGAAERVNIFTRAWQSAGVAISNAIDAAGRFASGQQSLEDRLAQTRAQLSRAEGGLFSRSPQSQAAIAALKEEIRLLEHRARTEKEYAADQAANANARRLGLEVGEITRRLEPDVTKLREMRAELNKINEFLKDDRAKGFANGIDDAAKAAGALTNAVESFLTTTQRVSAETGIQVRQILARTASEQLSVSLDRERLAMAGQIVSEKEREARLQQQVAAAQANATREQRDALRQLRDEASLAGLNPFQRRQQENEIFRRNLGERTNVLGGANDNARAGGIVPEFETAMRRLIAEVGDPGARMTSGFRSREQQEALFNRYGPGRAAAPGNSHHEHGTAMDYVFSSPQYRQRAMEMAGQFGVRARPSNGGAVHFDAGTRAAQANTQAVNDNVRALQAQRDTAEFVRGPLREYGVELDQGRRALELQNQAQTLSVRAMESARKEQEILNNFQRQGVPLTDEQRASVKRLAEAFGDLAQRQSSSRLMRDVQFERDQMGRSSVEQSVAGRLRGAYGDNYTSMLGSFEAQQLRINATMEQFGRIGDQAFSGIADALMNSTNRGQALQNVLKSTLAQIAQMGIQGLGRAIFGGFAGLFGAQPASGGGAGAIGAGFSLLSGLGGLFANGAAFGGGNVIPFANGGAFTNSIVNRPTIFPMANGAGLMGEAGPEGVLPLKRMAGGKLGVYAAGGGGGQSITIGGSSIIINGSADQSTIEQIRKEQARDREATAEAIRKIVSGEGGRTKEREWRAA